jgi:hypothetical protein
MQHPKLIATFFAAALLTSAGAGAAPKDTLSKTSFATKASEYLRTLTAKTSASKAPVAKPKTQATQCIGHNGALITPIQPSDCAGDVHVPRVLDPGIDPCTGRLCPEPENPDG